MRGDKCGNLLPDEFLGRFRDDARRSRRSGSARCVGAVETGHIQVSCASHKFDHLIDFLIAEGRDVGL